MYACEAWDIGSVGMEAVAQVSEGPAEGREGGDRRESAGCMVLDGSV